MRFLGVTLILQLLLFFTGHAEKLVVATGDIPPMVIVEANGHVKGFTAELWALLAKEMNIDYEYRVTDFNGILKMTATGESDLAFGAISVTKDREELYDYSHPLFNSGLRLMLKKKESALPMISTKALRMLGYLALFIVFCAHALWLAERGNPGIPRSYIAGIFGAGWCTVATMTTVGYGDIAPRSPAGRFMALMIMLTGISSFSVITAGLTSEFTADRIRSEIHDFDDLQNFKVATKSGTTSESYLLSKGISPITVPDITQAFHMLQDESVDVVVYDDPVIRYQCKINDKFISPGTTEEHQAYSFLFHQGSSYVEKVNRALLTVQENGSYSKLYRKWFGGK
jgi:polar amino acid transport system substrate-binding protein